MAASDCLRNKKNEIVVRSYTAQQKHESTLLHTYVLNEYLTILQFKKIFSALTKPKQMPRKIDQFECKRCQKKRNDVSYQLL